MTIVADRFLVTAGDGQAIDLATGGAARVFVDAHPAAADVRSRTAVCDRLATLRHPLLVPLLDYGMTGRHWFEAHALCGPLRMSAMQARGAVLHVIRFLCAAGIELTSELASRNVRTVAEDGSSGGRVIGVFLRDRAAVDVLRTVLEAAGPCGTTAIDVVGHEGAGLRTARLQIARIARLAGYVVIDAAVSEAEAIDVRGRHVCALEWMPRLRVLPAVLASAAVCGGRRHVWVRFRRQPPLATARAGDDRGATLQMEPIMIDELTSAIFLDAELGPRAEDVREAAEQARGWPGPAIAALVGVRAGRGAGWVHETSPAYGEPKPAARPLPPADAQSAGISRLERAAAAARALAARGRHARAARVLARCGPALAARGARRAASLAACELGELLLHRAQPARAVAAFEQARAWTTDGAIIVRALVGTGRALLDQARLVDAEAVFRTALAADEDVPGVSAARVWLARTLWHREQYDAALSVLQNGDAALQSRILLALDRLEDAARAAASAIDHANDPRAVADARLASAHVDAVLGNAAAVRADMDAALDAARRARNPTLRLAIAADRAACLARCGIPASRVQSARLLRAAARLPALPAAAIRSTIETASAPLERSRRGQADLVQHFQALIDAVHDTPDEAAALQVMAAGVLRTLHACSVAIRSARLERIVAAAGRSWAGEDALARVVLAGGAAVQRDGATPEAADAIVSAGAIVGSIALRWVAGAVPGWPRVRDVIKVTAVAAAPLLRALKPVETGGDADAGSPDMLLGRSAAAERVREAIRRAAAAPYPVLVEGESGSGKELVARSIHARSVRRAHQFCAINCAALADDLLEAELFGHARGAFTGAVAERPGLFEETDQGTLFLDEVGELSPRAQAKLLRVLQEGEVRRVGENVARRVDVRVVAATNRHLEQEVQAGRFRADLRFRLDVIRIAIPPLRERAEDLPWLIDRIWSDVASRVGSRAVLGPDMVGALARHDWPGNVRELQNVLASLAVHAPRRGRVPVSLLPLRLAHEAGRAPVGFDEARLDFERRFVRAALARAGGHRGVAASQLGVSRQGLIKMIKRLGIE